MTAICQVYKSNYYTTHIQPLEQWVKDYHNHKDAASYYAVRPACVDIKHHKDMTKMQLYDIAFEMTRHYWRMAKEQEHNNFINTVNQYRQSYE